MIYRIKVEEVQHGKFKHKFNIMCESHDFNNLIEKITEAIKEEVFLKIKNKLKAYDESFDDDLIDYKSRGKNTSKEDFLKQEMDVME
jgi:hypothetical protein